jgi:F-type H+/Na+-transporting ATPase subunit alpha
VRPAINVGISVSRVGGAAQITAMRRIAGRLRLDLAQYREMAAFAQFGSELDAATQSQLTRGERMVEILKQDQYKPLPVEKQVMIIYAGINGYLDDIPVEALRRFEEEFYPYIEGRNAALPREIKEKKQLDADMEAALRKAIEEFKADFMSRMKK